MANIDFYLNLLNNREKAIIFYALIFFIWVLFNKNVRYSFLSVLGVLFQIKFIALIVSMILYIGILVYAFYKIHLWDISLIKETVFWTFGVGFIALLNANKYMKEDHFFRKVFRDNIKTILAIEFIVSFYTFGLLVETIIIMPLLFIIAVMSVMVSMDKKNLLAKKFVDSILFLFGILFITLFLYNVFKDYRSFISFHNLMTFLLPIFLMVFFIPFLYLFAIIMTYESLFVRVDHFIDDNKLVAKFAKRRVFVLCLLNIKKLNDFEKESIIDISNLKGKNNSKNDVLEIIQKYKSKKNKIKDIENSNP